MRNYGRIETAAWQSTKLRGAGVEAKLLWAYLIACPHGNALGCFVLPLGYIAIDLELDQTTVANAVQTLSDRGLIEYDAPAQLVRIIGWWGHNTIENKNVAIGISKALKKLPKSNLAAQCLADMAALGNIYFDQHVKPDWTAIEPQSNRVTEPGPTATEPPDTRNLIPDSVANATGAVAPLAERDLDLPPFLDRSADLKTKLFGPCLDWLAAQSGKSTVALRSMVGKWISDWGDGAVLEAFVAAQKESPVDPVAWIRRALESRNAKRNDYRKPTAGQTARAGIAAALLTDA